MPRKLLLTGLMLFFSQTALGIENFITQATTLYPPACVSTAPLELVFTPSDTRDIFLGQMGKYTSFPDTQNQQNVEVFVYRRGCKDPDRSVIFLSTNLIAGPNSAFFLPRVFAKIGATRYSLRLVNEPNSFEQEQGGTIKGVGLREYILDGVAESKIASAENIISIAQYNGAFTLIIQDGFDPSLELEVPIDAYTGFQKPRKFPLNGRLSGNWVVQDVPDQGFVIAFNEVINASGVQNQVFLSWYTYNTDGSTLWLTAGAFNDLAADSVTLQLELVSNGTFLGSTIADRSVVGSATLTAISCNEMTLTYNLDNLGLGSGTVTLTRIFSVEIAGYACRDQTARLDALSN